LAAADLSFIVHFSLLAFGIVTAGFFLGYIGNILSVKAESKVTFDIYKKMLIHVNSIPFHNICNMDMVALNQRISTDVSTLVSFCIGNSLSVVVKSVTLLVYILIIFNSNRYYLLLILIFGILYYLSNKYFKKKLYTKDYNLKEKQNQYYAKTYEQFINIKFVKTQGLNGIFEHRIDNPFKHYLNAFISKQKIGYLFSGMDTFFTLLIQIIMIFFGGRTIISGKMTIGEFTIISSYITMAFVSIKFFYNLGQNIQTTLTSLNRLNEILDIKPEQNGSIKENNIYNISLKDYSVRFENTDIINHFNYNFTRGKIYSIIGNNGAGKTTLLLSLLGMYNTDKRGEVLINGLPLINFDMIYMRRKAIGYAEQDPTVVAGTVLENLLLSSENETTLSEIENELINMEKLSKNKIILGSGTTLSGGEKLKISLARVLHKTRDLILLDEPSSMLDSKSVEILINELIKIKQDRIIIIVTHDNRLVSISDEIINM
jgi:ATP-binding cassette subfamily C protein